MIRSETNLRNDRGKKLFPNFTNKKRIRCIWLNVERVIHGRQKCFEDLKSMIQTNKKILEYGEERTFSNKNEREGESVKMRHLQVI
jgi:hypothetical protein